MEFKTWQPKFFRYEYGSPYSGKSANLMKWENPEESLRRKYTTSFFEKTELAYNNGKISEHERVRLNNLYNSEKKIDAESQLAGYLKRTRKVKSSAKY